MESSPQQNGGSTADFPSQNGGASADQQNGDTAADFLQQNGGPAPSATPAFEDDNDGMFFGTPPGGVGGSDSFGAGQPGPPPPPQDDIKTNKFVSFLDQPFGQNFLTGSSGNNKGEHEDDKAEPFTWADQRNKPVVYDPESVAAWMAGRVSRPELGMAGCSSNFH